MKIDISPEFKIGQQLYLVHHGKSIDAEVTAYDVKVYKDGRKHKAVVPLYHINTFSVLFGDCTSTVPPQFLFEDKEEADRLSEVVNIDISEEVWKEAIGSREDFSHQDSEMSVCGGYLSDARDILYVAKNQGELTRFEIFHVWANLERGGFTKWAGHVVNLRTVFETLGFQIEDVEDDMFRISYS